MPAHKGNKYALGNKGGRPSKLSKEVLDKSKEYLEDCIDRYDENGKLKVSIPSLAGLARRLNVARETLANWKRENKEFLAICESILAEQEHRLLNGGLSGEYNSTITKLMMTKHGYSDKQELTGADGKPLNIVFDNAFTSASKENSTK